MKIENCKLKIEHVPHHVAFIMDGNRRWAKERGMSQLQGHVAGQDRIEPLIDHAIKLKIPCLTFWAFSTENWKRKKQEVNFLMKLFRQNLNKKINRFHKKNVRLRIIGDLNDFPDDIKEKTREWIRLTRDNKKITVNIALGYGGRDEIVRAIFKIQNSEFKIQDLNKENFGQFLDTSGQPDPDLLVRTGGEKRLSGFMLWQIEYTELYFTDIYWPDFTPNEFTKALEEFQNRQRRFGK